MANYLITRLAGGLGYTWSDSDLSKLETALDFAIRMRAFADEGTWATEKLEQVRRLHEGHQAPDQNAR